MSAAAVPPTPLITTDTRALSMWRSRLDSALRTALACALVGCATLYLPEAFRRHIGFPAFSYVTAVLVVGEGALGGALRGVVHAVYGTALGVPPATLALHLAGPEEYSASVTALAVAVTGFVLALPGSTSVLTKRVALGQTVLVYAAGLRGETRASAVLRPAHVAFSTAVGVAAAVLALTIPYPRFAFYQARQKSKEYIIMATERLKLLVEVFSADNGSSAAASISQEKSFAFTSSKLLKTIKAKQERLEWERPFFWFFPDQSNLTTSKLLAIEEPLKGMEVALDSMTSFSPKCSYPELQSLVHNLRDSINATLNQDNNNTPKTEPVDLNSQLVQNYSFPENPKELPTYFFIFCMNLLLNGPPENQLSIASRPERKVAPASVQTESSCQELPFTKRIKKTWLPNLECERLIMAAKCGLSLGSAMFFGMLFSFDNGFWSALIVAVTMTPWRDATFRIANVRAQGTALGSVYGVLVGLISQDLMEVRFAALLPWAILTSFLKHSRMYGQAGGVATMISTILILGRKYNDTPSAFAIARLTESFIGITCFVLVEIFLQPKRASTCARTKLLQCLGTLEECVQLLSFRGNASHELREKERELRRFLTELKKLIAEAEAEPNFWFLPFPIASYQKLRCSLSKTVELVLFLSYAMDQLSQHYTDHEADWGPINGDLDDIRKPIGSSLDSLVKIMQLKSLQKLNYELQESGDLELGNLPRQYGCGSLVPDQDECNKVAVSLMHHAKMMVMEKSDGDAKNQLEVYLCWATLGFCSTGLVKETSKIEKGILELVQWESPTSHINLHEIRCKILKQESV